MPRPANSSTKLAVRNLSDLFDLTSAKSHTMHRISYNIYVARSLVEIPVISDGKSSPAQVRKTNFLGIFRVIFLLPKCFDTYFLLTVEAGSAVAVVDKFQE
eukprot:scpid33187/ scgid16831/ 